MHRRLRARISERLRAAVVDARPVAGGDINDAWCVTLAGGRRAFVKTNPRAPEAMFPAEARGLAWLGQAGALRVPAVLAAERDFLALEHLEAAEPAPGFDERLGRGLAALHAAGAPRFGLDHDNFIGRLPQANGPAGGGLDWPAFYRDRRLAPQVAMAVDGGAMDGALRRDCDRLLGRLDDDLCGPPEPPARLHGDLWRGNLHVDERGEPCLVDPAAYAGHREVDLAMMRLFGGFSARVFAAYGESFPLAPGAEERVPLYQTYYLLVHLNLFGRAYLGAVREAVARALAI